MRFAFRTILAKLLLHLHLTMELILALFNLTARKPSFVPCEVNADIFFSFKWIENSNMKLNDTSYVRVIIYINI